MRIYIGHGKKINGCYKLTISNKLAKSVHTWSTFNFPLANKALQLVKDYKKALKTSGSIAEVTKALSNIRRQQENLRIEYSQLNDNLKNPVLLEAIENYQQF